MHGAAKAFTQTSRSPVSKLQFPHNPSIPADDGSLNLVPFRGPLLPNDRMCSFGITLQDCCRLSARLLNLAPLHFGLQFSLGLKSFRVHENEKSDAHQPEPPEHQKASSFNPGTESPECKLASSLSLVPRTLQSGGQYLGPRMI